MNDLVRYHHAEVAAHKLLTRMHLMTDCGRRRKHWSSCIDLCEAFGWDGWADWQRAVEIYNRMMAEKAAEFERAHA